MKLFDYKFDEDLFEFPLFKATDLILKEYNNTSEEGLVLEKDQELKETFKAYYDLLSVYQYNPYSEIEHWFIIRLIYSQKGIDSALYRYGEFFGLDFIIEWKIEDLVPIIKVEVSQSSIQQITSFSLFQRLIEGLISELLFYTQIGMDYGNVNIPYIHTFQSNHYTAFEFLNQGVARLRKVGGEPVKTFWRIMP